MGRLFVCLVVCIREGFSPEAVARLEYGGFLMLGYQKSSAAAPNPRNSCRLEYFQRVSFALAGASCMHTSLFVVVTQLACQPL